MPTTPPRPCARPGCPALTRVRYCPDHTPLARQAAQAYDSRRSADPVLARNAKIRNSFRWQTLRKQIRQSNPLCADPFGEHARRNQTSPTTQIHHIKPLSTHPELAYDPANLMPVCTACHARLESTPPEP